MRIGTIGAGEVALAVAREALARGHEIVLSSRSGPGALDGKAAELGRGASAATVEEAASLGYVLLAVPWKKVEAALRALPEWCPHRRQQPVRRDQPQSRSRRPRRHWRQRDCGWFCARGAHRQGIQFHSHGALQQGAGQGPRQTGDLRLR